MPLVTATPYNVQSIPLIKLLGDTGIAANSESITTDSGGNVYIVGYLSGDGAGGRDAILIKYDNTLTLQWQRLLGGTGDDFGYGVAVDTSDDIYVSVYSLSGTYGNSIHVAKYNSSGTIQWQREWYSSTSVGQAVATDSNDNVYGLAYGSAGFNVNAAKIIKWNSSGVHQTDRRLKGSNSPHDGRDIIVDSNDNVYVTGTTLNDFFIAKYNSSLALQWQRELAQGHTDGGYSVTIDDNDDIYIAGENRNPSGGAQRAFVAKYNSSGTIQWQRRLQSPGPFRGVTTDSSNNVYLAGDRSSNMLVAKYNSSGTIQWQREISGTGFARATDITVHKTTGKMYIAGYTVTQTQGVSDIMVIDFPTSGAASAIGTNFSVVNSTFTEEAGDMTETAGIMTDEANTSVQELASTLTDQAATLNEIIGT